MDRQFPPEIVQLIVEASLGPYDFPTEPDISATRYAMLRSFSLLNSTWYGVVQPELVRTVHFVAEGSVEEFLEMAERRGGTVEGVRHFFFGANSDLSLPVDSPTLARVLNFTPHLLGLYCGGVVLDLDNLARLQRLRRLQLVHVNIAGSRSSSLLCLPHLERLCMIETSLEDSASHFLTPAFLPQIRRIETSDNLDIIAPLIQQLEIVTTTHFFWNYSILSRAKSLLLLPLPQDSDDRLAMFSNLPSLPPFLHIGFSPVWFIDVQHAVAMALEEVLETKKTGLRIILLNDHGIDGSIRSLIQRFQERGIRVQMVAKGLNFDGAIEEMYRIRAKEKRAMEDIAGQGG